MRFGGRVLERPVHRVRLRRCFLLGQLPERFLPERPDVFQRDVRDPAADLLLRGGVYVRFGLCHRPGVLQRVLHGVRCRLQGERRLGGGMLQPAVPGGRVLERGDMRQRDVHERLYRVRVLRRLPGDGRMQLERLLLHPHYPLHL